MSTDASWLERMPEIYDRCLGPALFAPCARHLAGIVAAHRPRQVLELAAGSGILTAHLAQALPTAQLTATDLNAAMVAWAADRVDGATWLTSDAQSLEFADASFGLIACQFGVMFFPDKAAAFAQAARVLAPGGAFVFSVWDTVDRSPFPAALTSALADLFPDDAPDFVVRIPHGYHDHDRMRSDVAAGGLQVESIEPFVLRGRTDSARTLAEGFCGGTPLRFALRERGDVDQLTRSVGERMTARLGEGPLEGDLAGFVVTARRAG